MIFVKGLYCELWPKQSDFYKQNLKYITSNDILWDYYFSNISNFLRIFLKFSSLRIGKKYLLLINKVLSIHSIKYTVKLHPYTWYFQSNESFIFGIFSQSSSQKNIL